MLLLVLPGLAGCVRHEEPASSAAERPLDPVAATYLNQAIQALRDQDPARTLVFTDSARAYAPDHPYTYFVRGQAYYVLGRFDDARAAWDRTLELEPDNWAWWQSIGDVAFRQQKYPESLAHYRKAARMHPDPVSWHGMAGAYWEMGRPDSARLACEQALTLDAAYAPAYLSLSRMAEEEGLFPEALRHADAALRLDPDNLAYQYTVGLMLLRNNRYDEAAAALKAVERHRPQNVGVLLNLGQALQRAGQTEEAARYFERVEELRKEGVANDVPPGY